MSTATTVRVDDVSKYYKPAHTLERVCGYLFWVNVILWLVTVYNPVSLRTDILDIFQILFLLSVACSFAMSLISRVWLVPRAELKRRKSFLSDALGATLTEDQTSQYYNNPYSPSTLRLAANTMENALFTEAIAADMLFGRRAKTATFVVAWLAILAFRRSSLEAIAWITQLVFSAEIVAEWANLEALRYRAERVYDQLFQHFAAGRGQKTNEEAATILDAFTAYESAKSCAGILLSSDAFERLNPGLSKRWDSVRAQLGIEPACYRPFS